MAIGKPEAVEIFFSYSHKDEGLRQELVKHLSILNRQGFISNWHDRKITAGTEWAGEIDGHLRSASVILLLISSDFLASNYCYDKEMKVALERHEAGEAKVIPIILRHVDWMGAPFGKLQALPKQGKPVISWENQDEAFTDIARGIRAAIVEAAKLGKKEVTRDVTEILEKFKVRPKKYAGNELIADINIGDDIFSISEEQSECFRLTLGDAIRRSFDFNNSSEKYRNWLFAEGELADWLQEVDSSLFRVRIRLMFGTYRDIMFVDDDLKSKVCSYTGYELMEIIDDTDAPSDSHALHDLRQMVVDGTD